MTTVAHDIFTFPPALSQPIRKLDTATLYDCSQGTQGKNSTGMIGYDDLLSGRGIPPLLVTSGAADAEKTVAAKNYDDLISC
jgi:hypothetical protein